MIKASTCKTMIDKPTVSGEMAATASLAEVQGALPIEAVTMKLLPKALIRMENK